MNEKLLRESIIRGSLLAWIKEEKIKNEKGQPIEFDDHCFLLDLYVDDAKTIVIRKAAQVGVSTFAILKELHDAKYKVINQIHTLPTREDVWKFVPDKVDGIIKANPSIQITGKNEVEQKQIGKSFIYYKGTFTEKEAIMLTSDRNIYDEVDKSNAEVIRDYRSRLGASKIREEIYISTPTIPNFGIDVLWEQSDQKHWRFNCPKCNFRQHLEWEKNVDFENEIYICQKCHNKLTPEIIKSGQWEARFPDREISGYWIPQMIITWRTAADLIKEKEAAEDEQYFYNFILGLPYASPESQIPASLIYKNLIGKAGQDERNSAMGVDVQLRELYVILGNEKGIFGITKIEDKPEKSKWQRLEELMEVYETRYAVIDAGYSPNEVLAFARKHPYKVYMCHNKPDPKMAQIVRFMDEGKFTDKPKDFEIDIKVLIDRNRVLDSLLQDLKEGKIKFNFMAHDPRIEELVKHCQAEYSRTVTDRFGTERREWVASGKDDFLDALIYFKIALEKKLRYESE